MEKCTKNIAIPDLFACLNAKKVYGDCNIDYYYNNVNTAKNAKAGECLKCGLCEQICPQHLHIRDLLVEVAQTFEKK